MTFVCPYHSKLKPMVKQSVVGKVTTWKCPSCGTIIEQERVS